MPAVMLDRDAQAIALLCSRLALPRNGGPKPFGPAEWNRLAGTLRSTSFGRPGDLLGRSASELGEALPVAPELADRIHRLLSRGGQLAMELERLASLGIWVLTRADEDYPARLKQRLRGDAPPLFYGAGARHLLGQGGVAVVGSRDADDNALAFAREVGRFCASERAPVVSGAARGIDITAMLGSIDAGGTAVGIVAEALERLVRRRDLREPLSEGSLVVITPHNPDARFHVGNAMRRNRLIYCAADVAVVVASTVERGGTRAGAIEALEAGWVPVLVHDDGTPGNCDLISRGARRLADPGAVLESRRHEAAPPSLLDIDVEAERDEETTPPVEPSQSADIFRVAWPVLASFLAVPRSETEVAEHFSLQRGQARAWLQRANEEELLRREGRTRRYVVANRQETLDTL
jgi:predicted Rossmann fold nucleotide-binding protein DprA/Smf involved in DNA uptake